MIKKRIIPCLDVKDGTVVKGIQFKGLREIGDPVELAKRYNALGADELVFLATAVHPDDDRRRHQVDGRHFPLAERWSG